eukprot:91726-Amorphochlora_amoeboformis.AAC.1
MADLLDDILAGVEDTYKDVKPQESKEKNLSIRERQMSKFQAQMQRRALAQINNFRAKIQVPSTVILTERKHTQPKDFVIKIRNGS